MKSRYPIMNHVEGPPPTMIRSSSGNGPIGSTIIIVQIDAAIACTRAIFLSSMYSGALLFSSGRPLRLLNAKI